MATKFRIAAVAILVAGMVLGYFDFLSALDEVARGFKLGLDLRGGIQLVYEADTSTLTRNEVDEAMSGLRDVIERRVNLFGVSEPVVQVESASIFAGGEAGKNRLIVELPGIVDAEEAIRLIGETPLLEFRLESEDIPPEALAAVDPETLTEGSRYFAPTGLTGRFLERAMVQFDQLGVPTIGLEFTDEGADLFAKVTRENVGKRLAIFLDGAVLSAPVIQTVIEDGRAQITGTFTPDEVRALVRNLNSGALPIPIRLLSQQSVGATLGAGTLARGITAGLYGFIAVALFLVAWYRLPGVIAVVALGVYIVIVLALFKVIPVTITAAGIAGFILSIGMAVDANILIFERMKEEQRAGKDRIAAITEGFHRAWLSIRDSNVSSLITAVVLFWMGTSIVRGFALTLGIGVLVSMLSAITVSRSFLLAISFKEQNQHVRYPS